MSKTTFAVLTVIILTLSAIPFFASSEASKSDKDNDGYWYVDGNDPEPILKTDYIQVNTDPAAVGRDTLSYQAVVQADLGFNFNYYGQNYDKIYIGSYGAMSFVESTGLSRSPSKTMPSGASPRGVIAVHWSWYHCQSNDKSRLFTLQKEVDGEKAFIVEWNPTSGGRFQAILYSGGMIKFQYSSVPSAPVGSYTTIGIEKPDGMTGLVIANSVRRTIPLFKLPHAIAFVKDEVKVKDVDLVNGDGKRGDTIFAGSKPYHFQVEATHSGGAEKMSNILLTLGSLHGQENIKFIYYHKNKTFDQLSGMNHAQINHDLSTFDQNNDYLTVDFMVDFKIEYPSQDMRNVTGRAVGKSAVPDEMDIGELYWVETEVEWDPMDLYVFRTSDNRALRDNDYVAGEENIKFTGIKVVYESSDVQPPPTMFSLEITDNFNTKRVTYIQQGGMLDSTWISVDQSTLMTWTFEVVGFPKFSMLSDPFEFNLKVDIDRPDEVQSISIHADSKDDPPALNDNDGKVFVIWEEAQDGGSGIGSYLIKAEAEDYLIEKTVGSHVTWTELGQQIGKGLPEGTINISVTPVDDVGNIGPANWAFFQIDLTGPTYEVIDPAIGEWALSLRPDIKVRIVDELTGIQGESLDYRVSKDGGYTFDDWRSFYYFGSENDLIRTIKPDLWEGKGNILEFRGRDVANSTETRSEMIPIWVDANLPYIGMSEPEVDENGTTVHWLRNIEEPLRIKIHDWKGSGIDPNRISYRYSKNGGEAFSADIPLEGEGYNNSHGIFEYSFTLSKDWDQGRDNILVVDVYDKVGRNTTKTFRIKFDMIPEITLLSPLPTLKLYDNETVPFFMLVNDPDGGEDITIKWLSNIDGEIGAGQKLDVYLSAGDHIIQVTIYDGVYRVNKIFTITVHASILDDPRYKDSDGDGMNDSYEKAYGLNPLADDSKNDLDGDGHSNIEEYYANTDPTENNHYPGSEIFDDRFPLLPLILLIIALLVLIGSGVLLVREANKSKAVNVMAPPIIPAPSLPMGYQQDRQISQGPELQALPPSR